MLLGKHIAVDIAQDGLAKAQSAQSRIACQMRSHSAWYGLSFLENAMEFPAECIRSCSSRTVLSHSVCSKCKTQHYIHNQFIHRNPMCTLASTFCQAEEWNQRGTGKTDFFTETDGPNNFRHCVRTWELFVRIMLPNHSDAEKIDKGIMRRW